MAMHIPLIKRAKELGFYTITCDYIPEAPGHKIADEYHYDMLYGHIGESCVLEELLQAFKNGIHIILLLRSVLLRG